MKRTRYISIFGFFFFCHFVLAQTLIYDLCPVDHKDPPHFWGQIQAYDCQGPAQIDTDERVIRPDQFIKGAASSVSGKVSSLGSLKCVPGPDGMTVAINQLDF